MLFTVLVSSQRELLKTVGDLDMGWKKTARAFKVKCQWVALASSAGDVAPATGGLTNSVMTRSMHKASSNHWNAQPKDNNEDDLHTKQSSQV